MNKSTVAYMLSWACVFLAVWAGWGVDWRIITLVVALDMSGTLNKFARRIESETEK